MPLSPLQNNVASRPYPRFQPPRFNATASQAADSRPAQGQPRFGLAGSALAGIGNWLASKPWIKEPGISNSLQLANYLVKDKVLNTRTKEMLFEDLVGFGLLRSYIDYNRQYIFSPEGLKEKPKPNPGAARERAIREVASIATDNISAGALAWLIGWGANRTMNGYANQFASEEAMALFKQVAASGVTSSDQFLTKIATSIAPTSQISADAVAQLIRPALIPTAPGQYAQTVEEAALNVAKRLGKNTLDVDLGLTVRELGKTGQVKSAFFELPALLDEAKQLVRYVEPSVAKAGSAGWASEAQALLARTTRLNAWRLPVCLLTAMGLTYAVPYINKAITRKVDGIENYPGELGLRQVVKTKFVGDQTFAEKYFPYLAKSWSEGDMMPFVLSAIPLPFALGIIDSKKLSETASLVKAFNAPFKKGFMRIFQFGKGFPFTTQTQMAALFAFLIFSRMTASRSDIEFRERTVDSFAGWGLWILGTPLVKRVIASAMDISGKTSLTKTVGDATILKSKLEIGGLLQKGAVRTRSLSRYMGIGLGSLAATILLMGIIEPIAAIKWTEFQAKRNKPPLA